MLGSLDRWQRRTPLRAGVLQDNPSLQDDVLDSALARIPVIGAQIRDDIDPLAGSEIALAVGLAGALWVGLGVTVALGRAFEEIWDIPRLTSAAPCRHGCAASSSCWCSAWPSSR